MLRVCKASKCITSSPSFDQRYRCMHVLITTTNSFARSLTLTTIYERLAALQRDWYSFLFLFVRINKHMDWIWKAYLIHCRFGQVQTHRTAQYSAQTWFELFIRLGRTWLGSWFDTFSFGIRFIVRIGRCCRCGLHCCWCDRWWWWPWRSHQLLLCAYIFNLNVGRYDWNYVWIECIQINGLLLILHHRWYRWHRCWTTRFDYTVGHIGKMIIIWYGGSVSI